MILAVVFFFWNGTSFMLRAVSNYICILMFSLHLGMGTVVHLFVQIVQCILPVSLKLTTKHAHAGL